MSFQYYDAVVLCPACAGSGLDLRISTAVKSVRCEICEGTGIVKATDDVVFDPHVSPPSAVIRPVVPRIRH